MNMASAKQKTEISTEKLSNDFLTCPLCYDMYKTPKVLPCQHTFCLLCLRQYVSSRGFSSTLPCPMCKEVVKIPQNDVAQLKSNLTIVNLLQCVEESCRIASEEKSETSSPFVPGSMQRGSVCGACCDIKDLMSYCDNCGFWLCGTCTTSHQRVPATSQHALKKKNEINEFCQRTIRESETKILEVKELNSEKIEIILGHMQQLPANTDLTRNKIKTASDNACYIIREKEKELLHQLESFHRDQQDTWSTRLLVLEEQDDKIKNILRVLNEIKISTDCYKNHENTCAVERDIRDLIPLLDIQSIPEDTSSLSFSPFTFEQSALRHMNLGSLHVIKGTPDQNHFIHDHPPRMHTVAKLDEREYITGLAVNKFAEKLVAANNESVYVFQPNSRSPSRFKPFEQCSLKKPWGIAYTDVGNKVYITMAGVIEGEGFVYCSSVGGAKRTILASGLTLPRGIAVYNGFIYVCDQIDRCVYVFKSDGSICKVLKKMPDGNYYFNEPVFISVGAGGRIAVSDGYHSVKIFDDQYNLIYTYLPDFVDSQLWDVLVLHDGTTVVCDWNHGLHKISRDFESSGLIAVEGGELRETTALASLEDGNVIYVANGMGEICSVI